MSQPTYKTLAAIYQLLGTATAEELRATSKLPEVSANVRRALIALALEVSGAKPGKNGRDFQRVSSPEKQRTTNQLMPPASLPPKRAAIISLLSNRTNFPDKASLSRFANEIGAGVNISPKWGMPRAISALTTAIEKSPQVLAKVRISDHNLDSNTKGWIDIILGRK